MKNKLPAIFLLQIVIDFVHSNLSQSEQLLLTVQDSLDAVYQDHLQAQMRSFITPEGSHRQKRNSQFPKITRKKKKIRSCQNMAGILGGTNAFNFINFVAAVVTLIGKSSEYSLAALSSLILYTSTFRGATRNVSDCFKQSTSTIT